MKTIEFNKYYKKFGILSLVLIIISLSLLFFKGLNYGVDFKGGTLIEIRIENSDHSVSKVRGATELYKVILKYFPITLDLTLTDGTGNIGSDTAYLAPRFKKVNTIEKNTKTFRVLKNNIIVLGLNNVNLINGDTLEKLEKIKQDIIIIDAPWGGKDYKKNKVR